MFNIYICKSANNIALIFFIHINSDLITKTSNDVCEILKSLKLGQYETTFLENGIDGSTLAFITEDGFKYMLQETSFM